jgi:carboxyl-terminal processing protease
MTGLRSPIDSRLLQGVVLVALVLMQPARCTPTPVPPSAKSDLTDRQALAPKTRRAIFEKVWSEIHDHYYDPHFNGVDWNQVHDRYRPLIEATKNDHDFYALLSQMTGELHDAHTRFNSPSQWRNYKKQQGVGAGLSVDDVDGKTVIVHVRPDSSAAAAGIEPGMVLLSVDGTPVAERLAAIEKAVRRPA